MRCPKCDNAGSGIIESRKRVDHVWRRRRCYECNHIWHTMEIDKDFYVKMQDEALVLQELKRRVNVP